MEADIGMYEDIQSESYILIEEEEQKKSELKYGSVLEQALNIANKCLKDKLSEDISKLQEIFNNEDTVKALANNNDFAFLLIMMDIYEMEKEANIENNIFFWGDNIEDIINIINQIRFFLWEMEFLGDSGSGKLLMAYISDVNISMTAFEYIIFISSCDKEKIVRAINKLFQ